MQLNNWEKQLKYIEVMHTFTVEVAPLSVQQTSLSHM